MRVKTATADPGYFDGDSFDGDPMARCFARNKSAFQGIRACPVKKGGMIAHTHRVIHWGNQGESDEQRMALDWAAVPASTSTTVSLEQAGGGVQDRRSAPTLRTSRRMHHIAQLIRSGEMAKLRYAKVSNNIEAKKTLRDKRDIL
jgi:hypothetical protein